MTILRNRKQWNNRIQRIKLLMDMTKNNNANRVHIEGEYIVRNTMCYLFVRKEGILFG